jgi:hypothetical protein
MVAIGPPRISGVPASLLDLGRVLLEIAEGTVGLADAGVRVPTNDADGGHPSGCGPSPRSGNPASWLPKIK